MQLQILCERKSCTGLSQTYVNRWVTALKAQLFEGLGLKVIDDPSQQGLPKFLIYISTLPPGPHRTIAGQFSALYLDPKIRIFLHGLDAEHRGPHSFARDVQATMQAIGTALGGLQACRNTFMAPRLSYHHLRSTGRSWTQANKTIARLHAAAGYPNDAGGLDTLPPVLARNVLLALKSSSDELHCQTYRAVPRRRALLKAHLSSTTETTETIKSPPGLSPPLMTTGDLPQAVIDGRRALEQGNPQAALDFCVETALTEPGSGAALCAAEAKEAMAHFSDAQIFYRAHLAHQPADGATMVKLARLVGRAGDDPGARILLKMAVKASPKLIEARMNLGVALARLGDYDHASEQWQRVLDIEPEHAEARKLLSQLKTFQKRRTKN